MAAQKNTPAPVEVPAPVDLLALAQSEEIGKSARVYVPAFPGIDRAPMADGRLAEVQREQRADGTQGPLMLAVIRKPRAKGQVEGVQRYPAADIADARDALAKVGIRL